MHYKLIQYVYGNLILITAFENKLMLCESKKHKGLTQDICIWGKYSNIVVYFNLTKLCTYMLYCTAISRFKYHIPMCLVFFIQISLCFTYNDIWYNILQKNSLVTINAILEFWKRFNVEYPFDHNNLFSVVLWMNRVSIFTRRNMVISPTVARFRYTAPFYPS